MHARLVRYYSRFGFIPIRQVTGGKVSDLPDMLVWGGAGTRMDANVYEMLEKWTPIIRNRSVKSESTSESSSSESGDSGSGS
jgi:hypothetical protein